MLLQLFRCLFLPQQNTVIFFSPVACIDPIVNYYNKIKNMRSYGMVVAELINRKTKRVTVHRRERGARRKKQEGNHDGYQQEIKTKGPEDCPE